MADTDDALPRVIAAISSAILSRLVTRRLRRQLSCFISIYYFDYIAILISGPVIRRCRGRASA